MSLSSIRDPLLPKSEKNVIGSSENIKIVDNNNNQNPAHPIDPILAAQLQKEEEDLKNWSERFRQPKKSSKSPEVSQTESGKPFVKANTKKLIFQNIEASTTKRNGEKQVILKKVSGVAKPGELTFIMGASGAGKTTLLNILTGRNLKNIETSGEILVNNRQMEHSEMKKLSAYVQQDDVFISNLTVKETLHFSAKLRSPRILTNDERDDIVDELMVMFSLKKCENTRVGSLIDKSLSRGERKRLAFASEIMTDPPILFCDEPTSGLDSFMSHQVIKALGKLKTEGKTVICTIHQPSTSVFHMADSLILLAQGHVAYQGAAKNVDAFFNRCGYPIPKFVSSPDHFMKVTSNANNESEEEYKNRILKIVQEYEHSKSSESVTSSRSSRKDQTNDEKLSNYPRTWWCQFFYIFARSIRQLSREKTLIITKWLQTMMMALLAGLVYHNLQLQHEHLQSFKGFAFFSVQMMHLMFLIPSMQIFWSDYPVVIREYQANMYSPSAYFLAKTIADSIQYAMYPILFTALLLSLTGLPVQFSTFAHFLMIMIILSFTATALAQAVGCAVPTLSAGMTIVVMIALPFMVFGGFLIAYDSVPVYFIPFSWLSWFKYGFEAISIVYFRDVESIPGCDADSNCSTGKEFLESQAFHPDNLWFDYLALFLFIVAFKLIGIFFFTRRIQNT